MFIEYLLIHPSAKGFPRYKSAIMDAVRGVDVVGVGVGVGVVFVLVLVLVVLVLVLVLVLWELGCSPRACMYGWVRNARDWCVVWECESESVLRDACF